MGGVVQRSYARGMLVAQRREGVLDSNRSIQKKGICLNSVPGWIGELCSNVTAQEEQGTRSVGKLRKEGLKGIFNYQPSLTREQS